MNPMKRFVSIIAIVIGIVFSPLFATAESVYQFGDIEASSEQRVDFNLNVPASKTKPANAFRK